MVAYIDVSDYHRITGEKIKNYPHQNQKTKWKLQAISDPT